MSYIVDTDWIIDGLGGRVAAIGLIDVLREDGLSVSVVTLGEVFDGAFGIADPFQTMVNYGEFLSGFEVLDVSRPIVRVFAELRFTLRREGNLIPDLDLLIASTAIEHGLTLVTRNTRHFARIPGLTLHG